MYFKRSDKGFTLIELLVVIAIIGILSTVVLASLNTARLRSRDARRVSDIKQFQIALELAFDANRTYPTTAQGLAALATGGFIAVIPNDPLGAAYAYESSSATSYCIGTTLEGAIPTGNNLACLAGGGDPDELGAAINFAASE